jgi:hypothetical protein
MAHPLCAGSAESGWETASAYSWRQVFGIFVGGPTISSGSSTYMVRPVLDTCTRGAPSDTIRVRGIPTDRFSFQATGVCGSRTRTLLYKFTLSIPRSLWRPGRSLHTQKALIVQSSLDRRISRKSRRASEQGPASSTLFLHGVCLRDASRP